MSISKGQKVHMHVILTARGLLEQDLIALRPVAVPAAVSDALVRHRML